MLSPPTSTLRAAAGLVFRALPAFLAGLVFAVAILHPSTPSCPCDVPAAARAAPPAAPEERAAALPAQANRPHDPAIETAVLRIRGMNCGGCARALERALGKVDGVIEVRVTFEPARATISYDLHRVRMRRIVHVIEEAGFEAFEV